MRYEIAGGNVPSHPQLNIISTFKPGIYFLEASQSKADADAMRKQSENLTTEYDRLLTEHQTLQV